MRLITLLLFIVFVAPAFAQNKSLLNRIKEVENNLIPFVPVKGFNG